jgi:hypothetical protein
MYNAMSMGFSYPYPMMPQPVGIHPVKSHLDASSFQGFDRADQGSAADRPEECKKGKVEVDQDRGTSHNSEVSSSENSDKNDNIIDDESETRSTHSNIFGSIPPSQVTQDDQGSINYSGREIMSQTTNFSDKEINYINEFLSKSREDAYF